MATNNAFATPLCLPNNCQWNERTGEYSLNNEKRKSLYPVDKALDQLRKIKGPVCVVSIAGPCRKGKSYILSKAFDQDEVFPLGTSMDPETMGIWMWVVPNKIKDTDGQELTVVLLDSEGTEAVTSEGSDDHCIFTLTILLASVLIYNSVGVPSRNDVAGLDFITKLSQRIQLGSTDQPAKKAQEDSKLFFKTFPYFIWLLRDVALSLPKDCNKPKDYFLKRVFKSEPCSQDDKAGKVAESILNFFPGFEAFKLRPPSSDPEVLMNLNREEVQHNINKSFIREVQEFKVMLFSKLSPKRSFQDGVYVTGEALASLVNTYVAALNTPGMVPSVQSAWETFVHTKCTEAKCAAVQVYDKAMSTQLDKCQLPCDSDDIRKELRKDMQKHMAHLQQLKDYDERLAKEREELARHEQERKRTEEVRKRLEHEQKTREREMKVLKEKQEEDKRRLEEQFRADMQSQREQMKDMMTANMNEQRLERQAMIDQNQTLQGTIRSMNEAMERQNGQILEVQNQITELANRPPPRRSIRDWCRNQ
ncbi:PREDICTED: guanylate-binding protein 4-like [Acropora digitifera]|uniref:guanylate-binding protein 4-like n=1 Tax=Acropora digitifera TaxID=70779 RepID=UPI00077AE21E|nr:PREDICTED: guanylate-binding protein 4-like [Acropora digitifera]